MSSNHASTPEILLDPQKLSLEADPLSKWGVRLQNSSTYSPPKWGPPLEFINIQPPKMGSVVGTIFLKLRFFLKSQFRDFTVIMLYIPGSIALNETRTSKLHIVFFTDEYFQSVNHLQIDTIKCFSKKKRLQGISTMVFSTPNFDPGLSNPRIFDQELFNHEP